ncbi:MAG: hypothetical protein ACRECZ_05110, partial [Methylocella sp.]
MKVRDAITGDVCRANCWLRRLGLNPNPATGFGVHGAIDLETGNTRMIEVLTVNALSTIALLMA